MASHLDTLGAVHQGFSHFRFFEAQEAAISSVHACVACYIVTSVVLKSLKFLAFWFSLFFHFGVAAIKETWNDGGRPGNEAWYIYIACPIDEASECYTQKITYAVRFETCVHLIG